MNEYIPLCPFKDIPSLTGHTKVLTFLGGIDLKQKSLPTQKRRKDGFVPYTFHSRDRFLPFLMGQIFQHFLVLGSR